MLKIEIDNTTASIKEKEKVELTMILGKVGNRIVNGDTHGPIRDSFGEKVGHWSLDNEKP